MDLIEADLERGYMKRLALETCINFIARTISQTEFRRRKDQKTIKDNMYYALNLKPNQNQNASDFWQKVVSKMAYDNECLIVQSDTGDLLVADDFTRVEYGLVQDTFKDVVIGTFTYKRAFQRDECIYISFANEPIERLINSLFEDYGSLFGRIIEFQKRKKQVRASVFIDAVLRKDEKSTEQNDLVLNNMRKKLENNAFALFTTQKGMEYTEHSKNQGVSESVEEVNKVYEGALEITAKAFNIPVNLLRGDMADIEDQMKSYFMFCIDPLLKKITDELNARLISKQEFLSGKKIEAKRVRFSNMFDVASAVDKLIAAHVYNPNELRDELGSEPVDDDSMNQYVRTKNYAANGGGAEYE